MSTSNLVYTKRPTKVQRELNIWAIVWGLVWAFFIFIFIARVFWLQQVSVVGASMEPNYFTNQLLLVDQINKNFQRGQVVAVYDDKIVAQEANYFTRFQPGVRFLLKRIIALPGEDIEIIGSSVIIYNDTYPNGAVLGEDYISDSVKARMDSSNYTFERYSVPEGEYFVMGDNRTNSTDSRAPGKGSFPEFAILGQERIRFWPTVDFHLFELPQYTFSPIE